MNAALAGFPELSLGEFKQSENSHEAGRYGLVEYTKLKSFHLQIGPRTERRVTVFR